MEWNKQSDRREAFYKMISNTKKHLVDKGACFLSCDGGGGHKLSQWLKLMCPIA